MEVSSLWFNTQFTIERVPHVLKLKFLERRVIRPKVQIDFENENYHVKTINHPQELAQVLRLRFEVFFREFSTTKVKSFLPFDVDVHDFSCDHLIVKDKSNGEVIACYRLRVSTPAHPVKKFYSEGEFNIDSILSAPGNKLELGRACVHKNYRKGTVIGLLWKGLIEYARKSEARYMFGCTSINRKDFSHFPKIMAHLNQEKCLIEDFDVTVQPKYQLKFDLPVGEDRDDKFMNSLMHMYLLAGAKMGKTPAYDAEMDCLDMFTLMDMTKLPPSFERRFS